MSAFSNALKSALISESEDLSAIWTALNEQERDEVFAQLKQRMQENPELLYNIASADLQDRFINSPTKEKWFLRDSVHLKIFWDQNHIGVSFTASHDDVVFTDKYVKFVGCFEIVNEYIDKFTQRRIKTITVLGITATAYSIIRDMFKGCSHQG